MREYNIHRLFEASVTLKGIHALLELATGAATLAVGPVRVSNFFFALAQREWLGGAHIWVVNFLVRLADASLRGGQEFVAIYLLVVGVISMVLVVGSPASDPGRCALGFGVAAGRGRGCSCRLSRFLSRTACVAAP